MLKSKSPLKSLQGDGDAFKKELDAFALECQGVLDDTALKDRQPRIKKLETRLQELTKKLAKLGQKASKLTKGKETLSQSQFEEAKEEEIHRAESFKKQLNRISEKLKPDDVEEDYFRQVSEETGPKATSGSKDDTQVEEFGSDMSESDDLDELDNTPEDHPGAALSPEPRPESRSASPSKFGRLGLFRKSSKLGKDSASKLTDSTADVAEGAALTKKQEKQLEKERREQEKKDKKEKARLEKEAKEKEKKEKKEKEKKEKDKKKSKEKGKGGKKGGKEKNADDEEVKEEEENGGGEMGENLEGGEIEKKRDGSEIDEDEIEQIGDNQEELESDWEDSEEFDSPPPRKSLLKTADTLSEEEDSDESDEDIPTNNNKQTSDISSQRRVKSGEDTISSTTKSNAKGQSVRIQNQSKPADDDEEDDEEDDDEEEEEEEEEEETEEESEEEESEEEEETPIKYKDNVKGAASRRVIEEDEDDEDEYEDEEESESEEEEEDEEEEEEESEEEESDDYEDELEDTTGESEDESEDNPDEQVKQFEAVCDFEGEQDDDLSFKTGDILTIISAREDGWWMAEDEEGNKGLVPSTYLKLKKDDVDYRDIQSPENDNDDENSASKSGKELWKGLRKAVNEPPERRRAHSSRRRGRRRSVRPIPKMATSATDVLTAMGAIPSGFRPSTTAKLLKDDNYKLCNSLKAELSESNLGFKDLFWSPPENQIRSQPVRIQKILSVTMVKNMPQVGMGIEVKSRHVRIAIFDGEKILSNIHTVQASWSEADPKMWKFSPRVPNMLPSILDGDCFVRTNYTEQKIGLLFELCLSYVRTKTGERGEFSCGWMHLPLYDEGTGAPILNKVYDLPIKGGTPYEQDVDVDPSISRKASSGKLRSMLSAAKKPSLQFKLMTPTKEQKQWLEVLPDSVVSSSVYLPFLSKYRKLLADALLRDRIDLQNTDLIHSPFLANFPTATKYPDIMDALRMCWAEKKKTIKKPDKRDPEFMKSLFTSAFMESAYPLLMSPTLPQYKWADVKSEQDRWNEISGFMKETQAQSILHSLLSAGTQHAPFNMSEVTFDLLEAYNGSR